MDMLLRFNSVFRDMDDLKQAKEKVEWLDDNRSQKKNEVLEQKQYLEKFTLNQKTHDFEVLKQQLKTEYMNREEKMERRLREKEKCFEEEMKVEGLRMKKEKLEISENKKRLEEKQSEMMKGIQELVVQSQKLKDLSELLTKESERFISFAENQKGCDACGERFLEFMLSDKLPLNDLHNLEAPPLPKAAENYIEGDSGNENDQLSSPIVNNTGGAGTISWLRKCTKILTISPRKNLELDAPLEKTSGINDSEAVLSGDSEIQCDDGNAENPAYTNEESIADSALAGPKNRRKRNRVSESQAAASENQSEGRSDAVKDSDRPKRQRVAAADQNLGQKGSVATASQDRTIKGKEPILEANASNAIESMKKEVKYVRETQSEQVYTENASVANMVLRDDDKVIGTGVDSRDYKTESDDGENDHPGQASIGKKLWTFLIT